MLRGGKGNDILVGGTEQGSLPNSDTMFGDDGNDVALWRGGDGSEAFDGGPGKADALIFGNIDRDENNIPIISAGTERGTVSVGQSSLVGKARQRPDLVRQVVDNVRREGLAATVEKVRTPGIRRAIAAFQSACAHWPHQPVRGVVLEVPVDEPSLMLSVRRLATRSWSSARTRPLNDERPASTNDRT